MITGGPERAAYRHKNVIPANMSDTDPFWDIAPKLEETDHDAKSGDLDCIVCVEKIGTELRMYWRGKDHCTGSTAVGMLEWAKHDILHGN